jgi:hypothetical protein
MFVRLGVFLLSAVAVAMAAVPILVLIDLLDGGTGWGLCPAGLQACANPLTTAGEFVVFLSFGLFVVVVGIRLLMRLARNLQAEEYETQR